MRETEIVSIPAGKRGAREQGGDAQTRNRPNPTQGGGEDDKKPNLLFIISSNQAVSFPPPSALNHSNLNEKVTVSRVGREWALIGYINKYHFLTCEAEGFVGSLVVVQWLSKVPLRRR